MFITPTDGTNTDNLQHTLRHLHAKVSNLRSPHIRPRDQITGYFNWVNDAVRMLSTQIRQVDVNALILTHRYELILSAASAHAAVEGSGFIPGLLQVELEQREAAFNEALRILGVEIAKWNHNGTLVIADTTLYITHPDKLADVHFPNLVGVADRTVTLVVPILVIEELDSLKQSKDDRVRWRAGHALGIFDAISKIANQSGTASKSHPRISDANDESTSSTYVRLLFDPPNHIRLPINDDEIIARALALQPLAGRKITLLTYDTGQSTRARENGLIVLKLDRPQ